MTPDPFAPGTCRVCSCTDANACEGGCSWADDAQTICTLCLDASELAAKVLGILGQLGPRMRPPIVLPSPAWPDLTFEQQQLLTMAHRRIVEANREMLLEEISQDAINAMISQRAIVQFLAEHCPQHLVADEPVDELVIRLLEPHVGSRVVLAGGPLS